MHAVAGLVALNLCFLVWGYALLTAMRRPPSLADCGLAFCAGLGGLSFVASIVAVAGYVPAVVLVSVTTGLVAVALVMGLHRAGNLRVPRLPAVGSWPETVAVALIGLVVAAYSVLLLRDAAVRPLSEWDAWAIWTVKAKALVMLGRFETADFAGAWPQYPPLVPMMQSLVFRFVGSFDSQVVHVEYALLVIAFAAALWRLLAERATPLVGAAAALAVLLLPAFELNVPDAQGDVPVAVFSALMALFLAAWIVDRRHSALALAAAFGAFAAWTKDEGSMLVLALGTLAVAASAGRRPKMILPPLLATVVALGATLPWRAWTATHGAHVDAPLSSGLRFGYLRERFSAGTTIASDFWHHVGDAHAWFAGPYLLAAMSLLVLAKGPRRLAIFCLGAPAAAFALFVWGYMIRNDPLGVHWLLETSSGRTTMSLGLLAVVLMLFQLATLLGPPRRNHAPP